MKWQDTEFLNIIASFLLLLISLVLTFRPNSNKKAGRLLAMYFWVFFLAVFISYLVHFKYVIKVPHLFRTGFIFSVLIMPLSYCYVQQNLFPRKFGYVDLLHLLPLLIYLTDYFPFFGLSANEKIKLIQSLDIQQVRLDFGEGWFMPNNGHFLIRYAMASFYCTAQFKLIRKAELTQEHPVVFENPAIIRWLKMLTATQSIFFMLPLLAAFIVNAAGVAVISTFAAMVVSLLQGYYLFFKPEVLYGIHAFHPETVLNNRAPQELVADGKEHYYTDEMLDEMEPILEKYMETDKPFLKAGFKLSDMASKTGISAHRISAFCNRKRKLNFFGYINEYRINHLLEKIASGEHEKKTLEALSEECGFSSRVTFIRVFKAKMGQNPSTYLSNL
jgi:AraC-like DNA-binding protein